MAGLTGKSPDNFYKDLIQMDNSNSGVDATTRTVKDGEGTNSALALSDDQLSVTPNNDDTTSVFSVTDTDSNSLLSVDSSNDLVKAGIGQHIVNTQVKQFTMCSLEANPDTTNTWTALQTFGGDSPADIEMGTGSTPATSYTIASTADDLVQHVWYLPFSITIDSCHVWFGATAALGDTVKFSVMSYSVVTTAGSTSGDLSSGAEICVSPSTIAGAGREQAYYQALDISTADVDSGKMIMACAHQDGTNSDLTCSMQLIYHLR